MLRVENAIKEIKDAENESLNPFGEFRGASPSQMTLCDLIIVANMSFRGAYVKNYFENLNT